MRVAVSWQIHLLVFDAAPQPLDEDIVPPSPLPSTFITNIAESELSAHTGVALRADAVRNTAVEHRPRVLENAIEPAAISLDDAFSIVSCLHCSANNDIAVTAEA